MSRLDYFTIAVVAVCLLAIGFLLYKTSDLIGGKQQKDPVAQVSDALKEMGIEDEMLEDDEEILQEEPSIETPPTSGLITEPTPSKTTEKPNTAQSSTPIDEKQQKKSISTGDYLVVAGSFKQKHNAENEAARLRKLGYNNATVEIFNKGSLATLVVDRFATELQARSLVSELKTKNIESYLHRKR